MTWCTSIGSPVANRLTISPACCCAAFTSPRASVRNWPKDFSAPADEPGICIAAPCSLGIRSTFGRGVTASILIRLDLSDLKGLLLHLLGRADSAHACVVRTGGGDQV